VIGIVNYGCGNVGAIANIYKRLNTPFSMADTAAKLRAAAKLVLPGVGAFDWAMDRLNRSGMRDTLDEVVISRQTPVLGICVGMQMMARMSDEGRLAGLGWIAGQVRKFNVADIDDRTHLPHMGWNDVYPASAGGLFTSLETNARFYFLHSYYFAADDGANVIAFTSYHGEFASAVRSGNAYGVQFHPEKSHQWGIAVLRNFADL
jgi:glutamine amidotransferase